MEKQYDTIFEVISKLEGKVRYLYQKSSDASKLPWTSGCTTKQVYLSVIDALLLTNVIHLEMALSLNRHSQAISEYEKCFALKQTYVIMQEGYKRIKGYSGKNNIWKGIKSECANNSAILKKEIQKMDNIFGEFEKKNSLNKDLRDIFTHYDTDMALYCEKLYSIDEKSIISNYCSMATELLFPLEKLLEKIKDDIESFCPLVMSPAKCSRKQ